MMTTEERLERLEKAVASLVATLMDKAEGLDGNWGRPPHYDALERIKWALERDDG